METLTKDMTLKSKMEKNKFYSIARSTKVIKKGEVFSCLTSTQFETVDSIPKLYEILRNLHKLSHNNSHSKEFEEWKFLKNWNSYTIEKKNKLYDKWSSHELNIFIYFKD